MKPTKVAALVRPPRFVAGHTTFTHVRNLAGKSRRAGAQEKEPNNRLGFRLGFGPQRVASGRGVPAPPGLTIPGLRGGILSSITLAMIRLGRLARESGVTSSVPSSLASALSVCAPRNRSSRMALRSFSACASRRSASARSRMPRFFEEHRHGSGAVGKMAHLRSLQAWSVWYGRANMRSTTSFVLLRQRARNILEDFLRTRPSFKRVSRR